MAVYLDTRVEDSSSASTKTHAAWHRDHPILAVSVFEKDTSQGAIRLFSDDGTALQGELPRKESLQVTFLSWHPTLPLLAMGWESGEVCVWNHLSKTLHEPQTQHKRAVSRLQWSDGGSRIISIDSVGTCIGWKVDAGRGSLGTVFYHELRDSLTDITFRHRYSKGNTEIGRLARAAVEGDEEALNLFSDWQKLKEDENAREVHMSDSHDFYVGSTTGVIYFVSENGSCGDVLQMDGGVARLVHYAAKDMLVAITDTLVLAQFAIAEDGSLTEQSRVKLSGHGARVSVIWVGEGLIAVIAVLGMSKGYIRVWDLSRREAKLHAGLKTLATLLKTDGNESLMIKSVKCNCKGNKDVFPLDSDRFRLMGVQVPHFYLLGKDVIDCLELKRSKSASSLVEKVPGSKHVFRLPMRDFVGLEDCDSSVREAIMTFSFFLTLGDMDEAFKAIKAITNQAVWENMAKMCVQTKRLDVAKICLGKMGHARGAWALRQAEDEPEIEARAAILALQLGMIQEAEDLLEACGRYDLLIKLFEDSNQWERAIQVAQTHDRIRLRATYHNYAQHLEASGDIEKAIQMYEKSETHLFEVPRMLFDEPQALEQYMRNSRNKDMLKWWAQYMESIGEMEAALQFYEASEDYLSLLRVHCYFNNVEKACEIANETGDRAACFHLARYLENQDNIPEAVHFFSRAKAYSNAIRVCKENQMDEQLFNLALLANQKETLEAARYFEQRQGALEKAVTLYQKGGWSTKAAELALQSGDLGALQQAAQELGPNADPNLVKTTAERLAAVGKQDQAVLLLSASGQNERALELCLQSNVIITEELAETLSQNLSKSDKTKSSRILEKIAECCMKQENYHLAAKKFTQSGNKVQAMKALLKSGDTSKIIFFAGVSRQAEIYVLAANYLQSLDWRQNPDIMKHIVTYYTKARAYDLLSGFYESCAQVEIEEYQNYEKALGALNEAQNCLMQSGENPPKKLARLRAQMENVRRYVATQRLYTDSPSEAIAQCQELIQLNPEPAVRRGDIFAFMVQHYVNNKDFSAARACLEDMQATIPNVNISQFLDGEVLRAVYGSSTNPREMQKFSLLAKQSMRNGLNGFERDGHDSSGDEVEEDVSAVDGGI
ncbi:conserved hypothetical protein [Ixodes scapularis]|uniref:Intraflagellar transport protein 140 homolog n=1 Tax=Ixodes scapularis TaxID=6945 RepID=B7PZM1_IXOSC|nr:conserved hypothetical protein [Ixodes scapularis]|eukprot:XP_002405562.1 conserved hypothetical protein [Ixodes scapularis]